MKVIDKETGIEYEVEETLPAHVQETVDAFKAAIPGLELHKAQMMQLGENWGDKLENLGGDDEQSEKRMDTYYSLAAQTQGAIDRLQASIMCLEDNDTDGVGVSGVPDTVPDVQ